MTTNNPTTAPERVPAMTLGDITYIKHAETVGIDYCYVESAQGEVWVVEEYGDSCFYLTPDQADALADAIKAHAAAARSRGGE